MLKAEVVLIPASHKRPIAGAGWLSVRSKNESVVTLCQCTHFSQLRQWWPSLHAVFARMLGSCLHIVPIANAHISASMHSV